MTAEPIILSSVHLDGAMTHRVAAALGRRERIAIRTRATTRLARLTASMVMTSLTVHRTNVLHMARMMVVNVTATVRSGEDTVFLVEVQQAGLFHIEGVPDERRAAGKPEKGTIRLSAEQAGDHIVIQITDDEKYIYRPELELEGPKGTIAMGLSNIKDIIAFGFDPEKTFIFSDVEYIQHLYPNVIRVQKNINFNQIKGIFGFN